MVIKFQENGEASAYAVNSLFNVQDIVALITGGGSGLGRIIAHSLAANGAKAVYILDISQDGMEATKKSSQNPDVIHTIICDVTNKEALADAANRVREEVGYCDVVFANSGVLAGDTSETTDQVTSETAVKSLQGKLWETSVDDFTKTFRVNVAGAYFTAIAFLDLLDEGNRRAVVPQKSQVIVTSSVAGYVRDPKCGFVYAASKAAATHLSKQLATVLAPLKIRVNMLVPGFYPSAMTDSILAGAADPRIEGSVPQSLIPLGRTGTEDDLAGAALFLTSRAGSFINGNSLVTDGGTTSVLRSVY